jgi:hypothetical protein
VARRGRPLVQPHRFLGIDRPPLTFAVLLGEAEEPVGLGNAHEDGRLAGEIDLQFRRLAGAVADQPGHIVGDRLGDVVRQPAPGHLSSFVLGLALEPFENVVEEDAVSPAQLGRLEGALATLAAEQSRRATRQAR